MTDADTVYRDFIIDGDPASGAHKPIKSEIRDLENGIAQRVAALEAALISLPESNGVDDSAMFNEYKLKGRMKGGGKSYVIQNPIYLCEDFHLEDTNILANNTTVPAFRMIAYPGTPIDRVTLAGVKLDRGNSGGASDSAAFYSINIPNVRLYDCEAYGGGAGKLVFVYGGSPRIIRLRYGETRWDWNAVGIPTQEQLIGLTIQNAVDGVVDHPIGKNFTARIFWVAGQVYTYGLRVRNSAGVQYKITSFPGGTAGSTEPTHTSGAVTLNGVEYTAERRWGAGVAWAAGEQCLNGGQRYKSRNAGTSGTIAPTHLAGIACDAVDGSGIYWIRIGTEDRAYQTDAMNIVRCQGLTVKGGLLENAWEGIDVTGTGTVDKSIVVRSENIQLIGVTYRDIDGIAEKLGHWLSNSQSIGSSIVRAGLAGISASGASEDDRAHDVQVNEPEIIDTGANENWGVPNIVCGIWVTPGGLADVIDGLVINSPLIADRQAAPTMEVGIRNEGSVPLNVRGKTIIEGYTVAAMTGTVVADDPFYAGVAFPATQVPSVNANTLDDYEEGTFTPIITAATPPNPAASATVTGRYTKIGNQVTFTLMATLSSLGGGTTPGSGNLLIAGLPFTTGATFSFRFAVMISLVDLAAFPVTTLMATLGVGATTLSLTSMGDNVAAANLQWAALSATSIIAITGTYLI